MGSSFKILSAATELQSVHVQVELSFVYLVLCPRPERGRRGHVCGVARLASPGGVSASSRCRVLRRKRPPGHDTWR